MTREHLAWTKGGTAIFLRTQDDAVILRSTVPSPPGSRIEGTLDGDPPVGIKIKIHGSKLELDGTFTLRGRLLDAPRALRARVAALVAN